jgi:hypothetical protein
LLEEGDGIQSTKHCVLKNKQDGVLDKVDNVQKHNICQSLLVFPLMIKVNCFKAGFTTYILVHYLESENLK